MIQICETDYIPKHGYPKLGGQDGDESIVIEWDEPNPVLPHCRTALRGSRDCEPPATDPFRLRRGHRDDRASIPIGGGVSTVSASNSPPTTGAAW